MPDLSFPEIDLGQIMLEVGNNSVSNFCTLPVVFCFLLSVIVLLMPKYTHN